MNGLKVYVKQNGVYTEVVGNIVNITLDELLDEQLDQARLVVMNSLIDNYPPLTEFRLDYTKDGTVIKRLYMISGDPTSTEYLNPSE